MILAADDPPKGRGLRMSPIWSSAGTLIGQASNGANYGPNASCTGPGLETLASAL